MKLCKVEIEEYDGESDTVYDISVESHESYCVGDDSVAVHNSACTTRKMTGK